MKKVFLIVTVIIFTAFLSSCQGFLDDYNYSPVGAMSSGGSY